MKGSFNLLLTSMKPPLSIDEVPDSHARVLMSENAQFEVECLERAKAEISAQIGDYPRRLLQRAQEIKQETQRQMSACLL